MTSAQGTVTSCGPGQAFSLQFTCTGPSCVDLNGLPGTTCTTSGTTLTCTNDVVCSGPTNYTSDFTFNQAKLIVSQTQHITLKDFGEEINLTSDGTTGGTTAAGVDTGPAGSGGSNSSISTIPSSVGSTGLPSSGFLPSTASQNGTYIPPKQPPATNNPTLTNPTITKASVNSPHPTSDGPGTIVTNSKGSQTGSGLSAVPQTTWNNPAGLLATSSSAWAEWVANSISGSSPVTKGSDGTKWTTTVPGSRDGPETRVSETVPGPTWAASQSTANTDPHPSGQPGYHASEASPVAGSKTASGLPFYPGDGQSSYTGNGPFGASTQAAWSAQSSGAATSKNANSNPSGTPANGTPAQFSGAATSRAATSNSSGTPANGIPVSGSSGFAVTFDPTTGSNTAPPIAKFTNDAGSLRRRNAPGLWCVLLLFFGVLVQGISATSYASHAAAADIILVERDVADSNALVNHTQHDLMMRALVPGWKQFSDAFSEYLAGKLTKPEFAPNMIEELATAVCSNVAGKVITKALGVDLVEACVTALYAGNAIVAPELEFLAVFGASVVCNMLVSDALPGIEALTSAICDVPKPCSENLLTDPKNCGSCGNVCDTGVCANGACTSNTCTGQTCSTFGPCGPGGTCVCASTTESTGYCVDGSTPCAGLADCSSSANCASGEICASQSCCGRNVCVGATFCGASSNATNTTTSSAKLLRRTWDNATIGSIGNWDHPVRLF